MIQDLTSNIDIRGDYALFIDKNHFIGEWKLDDYVRLRILNCEPTFFRVIKDGEQQSSHGWIENGKIVQWG